VKSEWQNDGWQNDMNIYPKSRGLVTAMYVCGFVLWLIVGAYGLVLAGCVGRVAWELLGLGWAIGSRLLAAIGL
jgi:hypothetical protein